MGGLKLFAIVFAAVLVANLTTLVLAELLMVYQASQILSALQNPMASPLGSLPALGTVQALSAAQVERSSAIRDSERWIEEATEARKAKAEADRAANAARIERETCATWRRFYAKEKTQFNRTMMEQSCR